MGKSKRILMVFMVIILGINLLTGCGQGEDIGRGSQT